MALIAAPCIVTVAVCTLTFCPFFALINICRQKKMVLKSPVIALLSTSVLRTDIKLNLAIHLGNKIVTEHM
jgi:hypothetical protein